MFSREMCEMFKITFFYKSPPVAASWPSYCCIGRRISLRYQLELVWLNWLTFIYTCWISVFYPVILHLKVTEAATRSIKKKHLAMFTGKHPWSQLRTRLIKSFIKKMLQHRCFPVNIAKILRTFILKNIRKWLFLNPE